MGSTNDRTTNNAMPEQIKSAILRLGKKRANVIGYFLTFVGIFLIIKLVEIIFRNS